MSNTAGLVLRGDWCLRGLGVRFRLGLLFVWIESLFAEPLVAISGVVTILGLSQVNKSGQTGHTKLPADGVEGELYESFITEL